jgi:ribosomal-protein-serine acetyltransferase
MPMLLRSPTILIRPHEVHDIDPLFEAVQESIAEISPWLPWCHAAFSKTELADFIEVSRNGWLDRSQYHFVILDTAANRALGGISLNHIVRSNRLANMGYWVRTSATGRGVASAAVKLVAACGFRELGLTRIEIAAIPENAASCRVAERAGAKFEVVARNRLVMHGRAYDAALYSLVPGDLGGVP